jgi:predicted RNA-binding Zn-ribbon protein involved in translation (DUF1610 family)
MDDSFFDGKHDIFFKILRENAKFCVACGKELNIAHSNWHYPFCKQCRERIWAEHATRDMTEQFVADVKKRVRG